MLGVFLWLSVTIHLLNKLDANAIKDPRRHWPNGVVPYVMDRSFDDYWRSVVLGAMSEIQQKSCIKFVPKTNERNWMNILTSRSCGSQVGMNKDPGPQDATLGACGKNNNNVVHELMHNLGFYHEQSRSDRDDYLSVFKSNIKQPYLSNFNKLSLTDTTNLNTLYDWGSVVHYEWSAFAKDDTDPTHPAIESKPRGKVLGNRYGLSPNDVLKINLLYNCATNGGAKPPVGWCSDTNPLCPTWASHGDCSRNPAWLNTNCRKSCRQC